METLQPLGLTVPPFDRYRIHLRLARSVRFGFEHGGVLRGLVSACLKQHALPRGVIPFAPESGRVDYDAGDGYALGFTLVGESRRLADDLLNGLERLGTRQVSGPQPVLGGNFVVERCEALPPPDLDAELAALGDGPLVVDLLSPLRIERPSALRRRGAGYLNDDCFPVAWFLEGVRRRILELSGLPPCDGPPVSDSTELRVEHLLWMDMPVQGTRAKERPYTLGGVRGRLRLDGLTVPWRTALALGAHLHVGQKTHYGFGRYALRPADDAAATFQATSSAMAFTRCESLLDVASSPHVLERAADHVFADLRAERAQEGTLDSDPEPDLGRLAQQLRRGTYRPPALKGYVMPKPDGGVRPLAVPPMRDRVAQRAVVEVLAPAIDTLLEDSSYAYRRGFSRQGAARGVERAYDQGYRLVLDADIRAFFDMVNWQILFGKLRALYPLDSLVVLIESWVQAPVNLAGRTIDRRCGLPQGCPISPLLANLYLDSFDEALLDAGFRIVRYADDFVVLAKDLAAAERAREATRAALADLRLELNSDETAIRSFDDGFSYLGYLFCRSMVLEAKDNEPDLTLAPPALEADDIPAASWLAAVPFETLRQLVEQKADGNKRRGPRIIERVPLAAGDVDSSAILRPLYVTSPDVRLYLRKGTLVIDQGDSELDVPTASLSHLVLWGRCRATLPLLRGLAQRGIPTYCCHVSGELEGVFGPQEDDWALWLDQAKAAARPDLVLSFAAELVAARLKNLAAIVVRFGWDDASNLAADLRTLARDATNKTSVDAVRGLEGRGAALAFTSLTRSLAPEWGFEGRARRPPPDPVNAMLSFGYTLLHNHVSTALTVAGLHPRIGLYHRPRGAHHALASDLVEELRHLVEALTWTLIRRRQVKPSRDFRPSADGRYPALLTREAKRTFIDALENRLMTSFTPEEEEEAITYRAFMARQARQVRSLVRGEQTRYVPLVLSA